MSENVFVRVFAGKTATLSPAGSSLFPRTMAPPLIDLWPLKLELPNTPYNGSWACNEHELRSVWLKSDFSFSSCLILRGFWGESIQYFRRKRQNNIKCSVTGIHFKLWWRSGDGIVFLSVSPPLWSTHWNFSPAIGWVIMKSHKSSCDPSVLPWGHLRGSILEHTTMEIRNNDKNTKVVWLQIIGT